MTRTGSYSHQALHDQVARRGRQWQTPQIRRVQREIYTGYIKVVEVTHTTPHSGSSPALRSSALRLSWIGPISTTFLKSAVLYTDSICGPLRASLYLKAIVREVGETER